MGNLMSKRLMEAIRGKELELKVDAEELAEEWNRTMDRANADVETVAQSEKAAFAQQTAELWKIPAEELEPGRRRVRRLRVDREKVKDVKQKYGLGKKEVE